jgi:hypothetical protein
VSTLDRLRSRLATPADDLAWLVVAGGALALAAVLAWLAPTLASHYPAPSGDLFTVWKQDINPEPLEDVRSMLVLATPFVLAALVLTFGTARSARPALDPLLIALQLIGAALLVVAVLRQQRTGPLIAPHYFAPYLLSVPNLVAGVAIGLLLSAAAVWPPRWSWLGRAQTAFSRGAWWRWGALAIAIAATVIWLLPAVNTDSTAPSAGSLAAGHFPVQGEDYFAVVNGRTPLVDYISQYANLLPLVLEPLLRAVGPSITSLSISLCVLSAVAMLAIYGAFAQVTRNLWSALVLYLPWVAFSLLPWHDVGPYREFNGIYYGVFPGRYFGPFVLALLCALWLRTRRIPTYALFLFAGLVVLNNFEFGIGALFATIAAVAAGWDRSTPLRERLRDLLIQGGAGLLTALAFVCAVALIRTGQLPDPPLLTYYNRLFLREAFGLEPMHSLGLHWALYATYAAALLVAAVRYVRNEPDRVMTGMLAFSAVFGLVTGMYFVGRSLPFQLILLFPAWGFSLALIAWCAGDSLRAAAPDRLHLRRLLLPGVVALVGFGVMVASLDRLPRPDRQIHRLRAGGTPENLNPTIRYVESWTNPGEDILLLANAPDHLVADRAGVVNISPFNGRLSLFTPSDADRAIDQLEDAGGKLVIERASALPPLGIAFGIPELATILRQRGYTLVGEDPQLQLRVWRRQPS